MKKQKANIGKFMYFEWLIPLIDYFKIIKNKEKMFDIILPGIVSIVLVYIYQKANLVEHAVLKMSELLPNVLAILIGFTISAIAILIASGDEKIKILCNKKASDREIDGKQISIYQFILIILIYVLIQEILNLLFVFFVSFMRPLAFSIWFGNIALGVFVFYILHILAIIVRAIVQLYVVNYKT